MSNGPIALWHIDNQHSALRQADVDDDSAMVEVCAAYSLISTGTERLVANGLVPELMYDDMRVPYMEGSFEFPIKYGYSLTGKVGSDGRRVHLMHPHQNKCYAREQDLNILPDTIPLKRATLTANMETAINAIWDSRLLPGEKVVVVGFGIIGALVAHISNLTPATDIYVLEIDPLRARIAEQLGFQLIKTIDELQNSCDIAFHCSASSAGLQSAIDSVGLEGRVIELSWYGTEQVSLQLGRHFHNLRKRIVSSQVGHIPSHITAPSKTLRRKQTVSKLLQDSSLDSFITETISFTDAPKYFEALRKGHRTGLGCCIEYEYH